MLVYQERCHLEYDDIGEMWGQGSYPGALPSCSQVPVCWDFGGALGGWSAPGHHLLPRPLVIPGSRAGEVWWSIISGLLSSQRLCISPSRLTLNKLPQFFTLKSNRGQSNLRRSRTIPLPPPCFFFLYRNWILQWHVLSKESSIFLEYEEKLCDCICEACVYSLYWSSKDLILYKGKEAMVFSASVQITKNSSLLDLIGFEQEKQLELMEII